MEEYISLSNPQGKLGIVKCLGIVTFKNVASLLLENPQSQKVISVASLMNINLSHEFVTEATLRITSSTFLYCIATSP